MKTKALLSAAIFILSFPLHAESNWKHLLGITYAYSGQVRLDDGTLVDGTDVYTGSTELDLETGFGFSYEARNIKANSWGFGIGIEYIQPREFQNKGEIVGVDVKFSGEMATIQTTTLLISAIYQWENFYLPFGLAFSSVKYEPPSTFDGDVDSESGMGFHFGLGWNFNDKAFLELVSKAVPYSLKSKPDVGEEMDLGEGTFAYAGFNFKYNFF